MHNLFYILAIAAICAVIMMPATVPQITAFLDKRGVRTPFVLLSLYFIRNISRYRKITIEENGRPGELFYHCVYAFNAALILALAALAVRFLSR